MRFWHYSILDVLPKGQLLSQKREFDYLYEHKIQKNPYNHLLINYIYTYDDLDFKIYYNRLYNAFKKRGYNFKDKFGLIDTSKSDYFGNMKCFEGIHNDEYLLICFMNLLEKYRRWQKDFDKATFEKLYDVANKKFDLKGLNIEK